jgi:hypothetical protein
VKSQPGPPMAFGNAAKAEWRLIVWCRASGHQVEPDAAQLADRHDPDTPVLDWRERLDCSRCGGRDMLGFCLPEKRAAPRARLCKGSRRARLGELVAAPAARNAQAG